MQRSRRIGEVVAVAGAAAIVVGSFLPWVISGEARRDSYATVRAAQRIGVVGMPLWETVLSVWFVAPLLAALVLVGLAFERRWLARVAGAVLVVLAGGVALVVLVAPVERGIGPAVVLAGAAVLLVGLVLLRRRGAVPIDASPRDARPS